MEQVIETKNQEAQTEPEPIGGWLILPAIGLILAPINTTLKLYETWLDLSAFNPEALRSHAWHLMFILNCFSILFCGVVSSAFFRKRKSTVNWFSAFLISNLIFSFLLADRQGIVVHFVLMMIWVSYFSFSKRVKRTFIR